MIRPGTMRFGLLSLTAAALLAGVCGGIDVGAEAPPAAGVIRAAPEGGNATPPVLRRPAAAATRIPGPGLPTRTAVTDADLGAGMVAPTGGPNTPAGVAVPGGNGDAAVALPVPAEAGTDIVRVMRPPAITPSGKKAQIIKFKESPLDMVLQAYSIETGRTLLLAPGLPKISVTLFSKRTDMSKEEYLLAIQTLLSMNGVGLLDVGNQFVKVVPSKDMGSIGIKIEDGPITEYHHEQGRHVRQMIPLKHIDINEAKKAVEGFKSAAGQIQLFERTNSILVMDTSENVNRMIQILEYIDQPIVRREEANVRQILYATAADIKKTIDSIVAEAKKAEGKKQATETVTPRSSGSPGMVRRTVPGVIRAPRVTPGATLPTPTISALVEEAARGIIRGEVQTIADERTNVLIIITRPENMQFFNRIIDVLDIETTPDVTVEIFRLEYADAEEMEAMLNKLIGNQNNDDGPKVAVKEGEAAKGAPLSDFVPRSQKKVAAELSTQAKSNLGALDSESIKILADKRTNALVVMASRSDLATIGDVVADMDIMVSQVLIETVILEVSLSDELAAGVDWLQRSRVMYTGGEPTLGYAGRGGGGDNTPASAMGFNTASAFPSPVGAGLTYYLTLFNLNVDVVVQAAQNDSNTRIHSTPVVMTQDNKEAEIKATRQIYVYKGKRYAGDAAGNPIYEDDVEQQDVGITLTVTPRINAKGFVVMHIQQSVENVSGRQPVNGNDWPIITKREFGADLAVQSGETIVLGGLVLDSTERTTKQVPFLGDIPLLGWLFKSKGWKETRNEVIVFITPYVMNSPDEIRAEAERRGGTVDTSGWNEKGWSNSSLSESLAPKAEHGGMSATAKLPSVERHGAGVELLPFNE